VGRQKAEGRDKGAFGVLQPRKVAVDRVMPLRAARALHAIGASVLGSDPRPQARCARARIQASMRPRNAATCLRDSA